MSPVGVFRTHSSIRSWIPRSSLTVNIWSNSFFHNPCDGDAQPLLGFSVIAVSHRFPPFSDRFLSSWLHQVSQHLLDNWYRLVVLGRRTRKRDHRGEHVLLYVWVLREDRSIRQENVVAPTTASLLL